MKNFNSNNISVLNEAAKLCAELGPEDGVDPRYLHKEYRYKKDHQKSSRLCSEVARVLSMVLTGDMSNPLLQTLQVIDVTSESDGQFLCVTVGHYEADFVLDDLQLISELKLVQGYLRSAITQRVNRKRVPALKFRYVGIME